MAYQQPDRYQGVLFPPTVDEFVPEDAPVRAYDAMVEAMDLEHMGIEINHHKVVLTQLQAEHPFGHIKRNLNTGYFLLRGLDGVRAEMSLLANSFNIARLITLLGVSGLISKLNQI